MESKLNLDKHSRELFKNDASTDVRVVLLRTRGVLWLDLKHFGLNPVRYRMCLVYAVVRRVFAFTQHGGTKQKDTARAGFCLTRSVY